jgi:hypothetical protein
MVDFLQLASPLLNIHRFADTASNLCWYARSAGSLLSTFLFYMYILIGESMQVFVFLMFLLPLVSIFVPWVMGK